MSDPRQRMAEMMMGSSGAAQTAGAGTSPMDRARLDPTFGNGVGPDHDYYNPATFPPARMQQQQQQDPRAEFLRSEHDTSRAMEPYRNQKNVTNEQFYGGLGALGGAAYSAAHSIGAGLRGRGLGIPMEIALGAASGGLGMAGGQIAGRAFDRANVTPFHIRGQPNMDTPGSEERIGAGQANQQPMDPRDPRRFKVFAP
jgi:hypothetical protein